MVKMIVGLGNPGKKYAQTKHNIGFMVVDELAKLKAASFQHDKLFQAEVASFFEGGEKIYLIKPATFMNLSGKAVGALLTYFNIPKENLLVIYDDLDSELGRVRLRQQGSAGGHNGVKDIITHLGGNVFKRIKLGIGRPSQGGQPVVDYVLAPFSKQDTAIIQTGIEKAVQACALYAENVAFVDLMNRYN
ncbi:MAG: aminoacyl-tRNA hydrolase [Streptococcaceae bacterium]|jgi:PTH1 family peptidyl-tRNA hydrolase|nr:aminoacyl-tRNA hydrolase [Streptococcaceae bacterium]